MYCMQLMPSAKTFITTTLQQVHRKLVISIHLFCMNLSGESTGTKQFISANKSIVIGREQEKHMA